MNDEVSRSKAKPSEASWGMKGEWMKKNCNKKYEELGAEPSEEYFFAKWLV